MTKRTFIIYIGIGCLLAVMACLSYSNTRRQMLEVAELTFVEAVHLDLNVRLKKSGERIVYSRGKEKPQYTTFTIQSDEGTKEYSIKDLDYSQNIDKDFYERMLHSSSPQFISACHPDTLQYIWQKILAQRSIESSNRVVVTDARRDVSELCDSLSIDASFQPLPTYYAGMLNEIQLNGFIRLSFLSVFCFYPTLWGLVFLLAGWVIFVAGKLFLFHQKTSAAQKGIYRLSRDVIYNPRLQCFMKGKAEIRLYPKSNAIIKALLEAENRQLHGADLLAIGWGTDESNFEKLYTQNSLIRKTLKELGDGYRIDSVEGGFFRFVTPDTIDE